MRRMTLRTALSALVLLALVSCGDDDRDSTTAYISSCEHACIRLHDCNSNVDIDDCAMDCQEDAARVGPRLSASFLSELDACIDRSSCVQLMAQPVSMACQREAAARLGPSPAAEELCEAVVASVQMCLGVTLPGAGCLDTVKIFADPYLESARGCDQVPCDMRAGCLQDELGTDPSEM